MQYFKYIFFDIDDTLFPTTEFANNAQAEALKKMVALLKNVDVYNNVYTKIEKDIDVKWFNNKLIKAKEKFDSITDKGLGLAKLYHDYMRHSDKMRFVLGVELYETYQEFKFEYRELFNSYVTRIDFHYDLRLSDIQKSILIAAAILEYDKEMINKMEGYDDIKTVLRDLKDIYKIGIISNGNELVQSYKINRLSLTEYFKTDKIFISDAIGIRKPNELIFKVILDKLSAKPEECVYVGDNGKNDIDPAHKAGLCTVHLQRPYGKYLGTTTETKPCFIIKELKDLINTIEKEPCQNKDCKNRRCPRYTHKLNKVATAFVAG